ncbi:TetR/AcrR family transcriptional regulator [Mycolicibacterium sediminis]|nr:TetR/AcrR family transcriptional regulator [Mycolicibacterium sediminis]
MPTKGPSGTVTRADWAAAALVALRAGGPSAVRVEAIARTLGVSKGSFYWHFADRRELLETAIAAWEAESTEAIIAESERGEDAADKLRRLVSRVTRSFDGDVAPGELMLYLEAEREGVRESVERVVDRRLDYVAALLVELGHDEAEAQRRAALAITVVVGAYQLVIGAPGPMSRRSLSHGAFADTLFGALTR